MSTVLLSGVLDNCGLHRIYADGIAAADHSPHPYAASYCRDELHDDDLDTAAAELAMAEVDDEMAADAESLARWEVMRAIHDLTNRYGALALHTVLTELGYAPSV